MISFSIGHMIRTVNFCFTDLAAVQARLALSSVTDDKAYIVGLVFGGFVAGVICSTAIAAAIGISVYFYCQKKKIQ